MLLINTQLLLQKPFGADQLLGGLYLFVQFGLDYLLEGDVGCGQGRVCAGLRLRNLAEVETRSYWKFGDFCWR